MKYFVLKPRAKTKNDAYANASQAAMHTYADAIEEHNQALANELRSWAQSETARQHQSLPTEEE